jgi:ABC-type multidrug transport system fused ATPase/permease subunit
MVSWKMALLLLAVTPFIFGVVVLLDKKAKPVYVDLRGKLENGTSSAGCYTVYIRCGGAS